jgi:hypothetical protein
MITLFAYEKVAFSFSYLSNEPGTGLKNAETKSPGAKKIRGLKFRSSGTKHIYFQHGIFSPQTILTFTVEGAFTSGPFYSVRKIRWRSRGGTCTR